jgi:hypothetical protein
MVRLLAELAGKYPGGRAFTTREVIRQAGSDEVKEGGRRSRTC